MKPSRSGKHFIPAIILFIITLSSFQDKQTIFKALNGDVRFISDAPLEVITASSSELKGVIDTSRHTFAFSVAIRSFHGFNNPLQREHFNENYMESGIHPNASFSGKIIEEINYAVNGIYDVRAKGVLNIRGVKQERIIRSKMEISDDGIIVRSTFNVALEDHEIKIPRVVFQKIAPDIKVEIYALLKPTSI